VPKSCLFPFQPLPWFVATMTHFPAKLILTPQILQKLFCWFSTVNRWKSGTGSVLVHAQNNDSNIFRCHKRLRSSALKNLSYNSRILMTWAQIADEATQTWFHSGY
jgi:hypothetical protein